MILADSIEHCRAAFGFAKAFEVTVQIPLGRGGDVLRFEGGCGEQRREQEAEEKRHFHIYQAYACFDEKVTRGRLFFAQPLFWFLEVFGSHLEFPEGNGAVVALNKEVILGNPALPLGRAGVAIEGDGLLDELSVEMDGEEAGFFEEFAISIKARSPEFDGQGLPFPGGFGGVHEGRVAFVALGSALVIPAVIDGAHVSVGCLLFTVAVEDLDFVTAHEVNAGVGPFGDHELGLDGAVAELIDSLEVGRFFGAGGIGENFGFRASDCCEALVGGNDVACRLPALSGLKDFIPGSGVGGGDGESESSEDAEHDGESYAWIPDFRSER